jgi:hypothetical protein
MTLDAIAKVSFGEANPKGNQDINLALAGVRQGSVPSGTFRRVGRATYVARDVEHAALGRALEALGKALAEHGGSIEFLSVTIHRSELKASPSDAKNTARGQKDAKLLEEVKRAILKTTQGRAAPK